MRVLWQDIRFGVRMLRNSPGFTVVAVLTLALGIAINATVFSWINSVLLHPFPGVGDAKRVDLIEMMTPAGEHLDGSSYTDYRDYRAKLRLVSGVALGRFTPLSIGADGRTGRAWAEPVSANYFDVLQVKPVLGRTFRPEEGGEQAGAYPVAVISYGMWRSRYHSDPKVLGKIIRLNRHDLTIVGVAPPQFHGSLVGVVFDVWMPITMAPEMGTGDGTLTYRATRDLTSMIIRLKPGVTIEQARAEVSALARRLAAMYPGTNQGVDATVVPVGEGHLGLQGLLLKPLRILIAVCALLLLIVCANVANLLLARAVSRQKEFGIRLALGARRGRLARQLLTETLILAGTGAAVGVILVMWMGPALLLLAPRIDVPLDLGGGVNLPTLAFTVLIAAVATVISGMAPVLFSVRADLNEALKEGGRSGGSGTRSHRLRGMLVMAQVALAMVALVGAGLFYRSFRNTVGIRPGFDMNNVSVSQFYLSYAGYSAQEQWTFCRKLRERLEAEPGVVDVTYSDEVPLGHPVGTSPLQRLEIEGYVPARNEQMMIHRATVPPGYFQFMRIPLLEGREFTDRDDEHASEMRIIVNETFARRFFRGRDPIGRELKMENGLAIVVGLVKDSKYHSLAEAPLPFFYLPFRQWFRPGLNFSVFLRTAGDPLQMTPVLRREALALNQDAVFSTKLLAEAAAASLYPQTVAATLMSVVGLICVLLAAIGLYSVISYAVSQRTQELGIRVALGAQPSDVRGLVIQEGLKLLLPGLAAGAAAAVLAARAVNGMLIQVSPTDPATLAAAALLLGLIGVAASYVPALRATRIEPMRALHCA
ncbi:MAG: ABC transporter permease [Bryobacteraceae bacterium]